MITPKKAGDSGWDGGPSAGAASLQMGGADKEHVGGVHDSGTELGSTLRQRRPIPLADLPAIDVTGVNVDDIHHEIEEVEFADIIRRTGSSFSLDSGQEEKDHFISPTWQQNLREIVTHKIFVYFIYLCIAYNTVTIAMNDFYVDRDRGSTMQVMIEVSDWVVLVIFTLEMVLKILALGSGLKKLFGWEAEKKFMFGDDDVFDLEEEDAYFSSKWNRLDCSIVVVSWLLMIIQYSGQSAQTEVGRLVRILRIARPLRALRSSDGTEDVLKTFPHAIPAMRDVLSLLIFVFIVYAILGVNLFGVEGNFHGRCVVDSDEGIAQGTQGLLQKGWLNGIEPLCGDGFSCAQGFRCSCKAKRFDNGSLEVGHPFSFEADEGCYNPTRRPWVDGNSTSNWPVCPQYGQKCFNNVALALYVCFTSITLDSWTEMMWYAQDTMDTTAGWAYFVSLIVIVSFNIVNLYVAVISGAYRSVSKKRIQINKMKKSDKMLKRMHNEIIRLGIDTEQGKVMTRRLESLTGTSWLSRVRTSLISRISVLSVDRKLNPVALVARKVTMAPNRVDERGVVVPGDVLINAHDRHLRIVFGPELGEWSLYAHGGQATLLAVAGDRDLERSESMKMIRKTRSFAKKEAIASGVTQDKELAKKGEGGLLELRKALGLFERVEGVKGGVEEKYDGQEVSFFDLVVLFCIILNTVCMMLEHFLGTPSESSDFPPEFNCCDAACTERDAILCPHGIVTVEKTWTLGLGYAELAFNIIFTAELIIKLVSFWSLSAWAVNVFPGNILDAIIIIVSDVIYVVSIFHAATFNVNILRLMRILRAFRLVSRLRRLRLLFNKAYASFKAILHVLFVLIFWHVLGALLGMQIFRCDFRDESICHQQPDGRCPVGCSLWLGSPPQCVFTQEEMWERCAWDEYHSFNTFYESFVLLLFVTTGENWVSMMETGMRATPSVWPSLVFFIVFYIVSFYMLFSLFIGVILQEFELTDEQKMGMQLGYFRVKVLKELKRKRLRKRVNFAGAENAALLVGAPGGVAGANGMMGGAQGESDVEGGTFDTNEEDHESYLRGEENTLEDEGLLNNSVIFGCLPEPTPNARFPDSPKNIRAHVHDLVNNTYYDRLILVVILLSAVFLALDSPVREFTLLDSKIMWNADYAFFAVFAVEFVLKLMDYGIYWENKRAYFRNPWNGLDFIILLFQLLDLAGANGAKVMRIMRVLRPLRVLNKIKSLQLLIVAVQACAVDMFNVMILWIFAFIVFGIVGVSMFAGTFYSCNDLRFVGPPFNPTEEVGSLIGWRENCVGSFFSTVNADGDSFVSDSFETGILLPRVWSNPHDGASVTCYHFDNFGQAVQTLFEVSTFEQWSDVAFSATSATKVGQQPVSKHNNNSIFFLHAWVVLSCFFVLQLVIGVLVDAINQKSAKALYTSLQRNWVQMEMKLIGLKPLAPLIVPKSKLRNRVWAFVNHSYFQNSITAVICLNILFMVTESYGQSIEYTLYSLYINAIFIAIYSFEIILKLIAYLHRFFLDPWNNFDLVVVVSSMFELAFSGSGQGGSGLQVLRVLRILKVFRTIRLVRRARRLRLIVNALLRSVPHIASSLLLLALFVFLFAVLGMQLFAGVRTGYGLHRRNNFENALNGCLLLLRVLTGENWETVMRDCSIEAPYCTSTEEVIHEMHRRGFQGDNFLGDCGSATGAIVYFDVFYCIGNNVLLNLFIAVLLDNFFTMQSNFVLSEAHLESFQKVWRDIDPLSKGVISLWRFRELVERLHADHNPLGSCALANEIKFRCVRIELMQDRPEGRELDFSETVATLALHVVGSHGLPYAEMVKRQEKVAYFVQLAAISRVTTVYRSINHSKALLAFRRGAQDEEELQGSALIQKICRDLTDDYMVRETAPLTGCTRQAASVAEISLSAIGYCDLERAIDDVEVMLHAVQKTDRYIAGAYSALKQLVSERNRRVGTWPQEHPKRR